MGKMKEMDLLLYRVAANHDPIMDLRLVASLDLPNSAGSSGERVSDPSLYGPSPQKHEASDTSSSLNNSVTTAQPSEHGGLISDAEQGTCATCELVFSMLEDLDIAFEEIDDWHCKDCGV